MRVKDIKMKTIESLLQQANPDLYITAISFEDDNYVLKLEMPYDDSEKRKEEYNALMADIMQWIRENDQNPNFLYNSDGE